MVLIDQLLEARGDTLFGADVSVNVLIQVPPAEEPGDSPSSLCFLSLLSQQVVITRCRLHSHADFS